MLLALWFHHSTRDEHWFQYQLLPVVETNFRCRHTAKPLMGPVPPLVLGRGQELVRPSRQ